MKKSALALILAVLMAVGLLTIGAAADGTALPKPVNGVITLTENVTLSTTQHFDGNVTIDLAGHTITCGITEKTEEKINGASKNVTSLFWVDPGVKLTIMDSGTNGTVIVNGTNGQTGGFGIYCVYVCGGGEFTLESGTLRNNNSAFEAYEVITNYGTVNINGGSISGITGIFMFNPARGDSKWTGVATTNVNGGEIIGIACETYKGNPSPNKGWNYGIGIYGPGASGDTVDNTKSILNINGGTIRAGQAIATNASGGKYAGYTLNMTGGTVDGTVDGTGMYLPAIGINNISGGIITGAQGIRICAGELDITDGTIIGTEAYNNNTDLVNGGSGGTAGAIVVGKAGDSGYVGSIDVNISGDAEIKNLAEEGAAIVVSDKNMAASTYENLGISVDITGGTITGDVRKVSNLSNTGTSDGGNTTLTLDGARVTGNVINSTNDGSVLVKNSAITGNIKNESTSGSMAVISSSAVSVDKNNVAVFDSTIAGQDMHEVGNAKATINGALYESLQAAIDAAGAGDTVTMLADADENVNIGDGKDIILDLNGCTLDGGTTPSKAALTNYGTVVIKDTSEGQKGMIKRSDEGASAYYTIQNEGDMTINSGNVWNNSGSSDKWSGSSLVCNGLEKTATLTINGGYFRQDNFIAVKNDENGELTINGGTIESKTQAVQNWCAAEIKDGTMTGTVSTWAYNRYDGETKISGGTINGDVTSCWFSDGSYKVNEGIAPEVVITGGHITGELYKANATSLDGTERVEDSTEGGSLTVKGGTFEEPVSNLFVDSSLNYRAWDGTKYSYHETRAAALAAAGANGIVSAVEGEGKVVYSVYYYTGTTGSEYRSETYIANDYATVISAPSKPGYIFMGWKCSDGNTHQAGEVIKVTKNMTFTAIWANMPDITPGTPDDDDEPVVPDFPFTDVREGQWFYEAVKYVYDEGIMNGMDRYTFDPNGSLTRAMVWTMLARHEGVDTEGGATWYSKAQEWAVEAGVSDGTDPMGNITREQLVTMLWRLNGSENVTGSLTGFTDYDKVSDWAGNAMLWATVNGIIEGDEANALNPTAGCTRAQAAAMIMRFCAYHEADSFGTVV